MQNKKIALLKIRNAFIASMISASFTLLGAIMVLKGKMNLPPFMIYDFILTVILGVMLFIEKSRVSAILLLLHFLSGKILHFQWYLQRPLSIIIALLFIYFFIEGIKGSFLYHKNPITKQSS